MEKMQLCGEGDSFVQRWLNIFSREHRHLTRKLRVKSCWRCATFFGRFVVPVRNVVLKPLAGLGYLQAAVIYYVLALEGGSKSWVMDNLVTLYVTAHAAQRPFSYKGRWTAWAVSVDIARV